MPTTTGVPGGALPFSGPLDIAAINSEWGLGTDLAVYHGARWYYDGNLTTGLFGGDTIRVSDFRGKRSTDPASGGTYFSNTVGSGSYTTSLYRNSITIEIWGAGGGGGGGNGGAGSKGGDSSVLSVTAGGGAGGTAGSIPVPPDPIVVTVDGRGGREPSYAIGGYFNSTRGEYGFVNADNSLTVSDKKTVEAALQGGLGSEPSTCFVAGTPVMMYDRTYKSIEQIKVGDKVIGAFGEINTVLLLRHTFIGDRYMYRVNDEHLTTEDHMHVSSDKKFYSFNPERQKKSWNKWLPVLDQTGKEIEYFNLGFELDRLNKLELGIELQTVNGGKKLITAEKLIYESDTPLFNLIVDGSHTYTANGYAVVGGPREDDFNYDTWMIKD